MIKRCLGAENKALDAHSRKAILLVVMSIKVVGLEELKNEYASDPYLGIIYIDLQKNIAAIHPHLFNEWLSFYAN